MFVDLVNNQIEMEFAEMLGNFNNIINYFCTKTMTSK